MCALPSTIDSASPLGSDSPALGDDQLRALKLYIVDVMGVPNASAVTAAPFAITTAGVVTVGQSPLTVPTLLRGAASQILRIESQYSSIVLGIDGASSLSVTPTGIRMATQFIEWPSGVTGTLRTLGAQPIRLGTNNVDRWAIDASGMFAPVASVVDLGSIAGPNPRNLYVASNLLVGGQIQAGAAPRIVTTPTGLLDLTQGAVSGEVRGDLLIRSSSGWARLGGGVSGYLLQAQSTTSDPLWVAQPGVAILDRVTADTTVANTTVETTLYTVSVPGGTLSTNRRLRLGLLCQWGYSINDTVTVTLRLKYGATTIASIANGGDGTNVAVTAGGLKIEACVSGDGATGSQVGLLIGIFDIGVKGNVPKIFQTLASRGTAAIDSTVAQTLEVTAQWSAPVVADTLTMEQALLERL